MSTSCLINYLSILYFTKWRSLTIVGPLAALPTTVGSRSTNTALGTCLPAPVSEKKVLKESSPPPMVLSLGIWPSGWIPCSKQYNSQQAFPIWTPACPTWIEIHSRWKTTEWRRYNVNIHIMARGGGGVYKLFMASVVCRPTVSSIMNYETCCVGLLGNLFYRFQHWFEELCLTKIIIIQIIIVQQQ